MTDKSTLQIIAESWPLAVMFIAVCAATAVHRVIGWFKKSDEDDKAYRADQARAVVAIRHPRTTNDEG